MVPGGSVAQSQSLGRTWTANHLYVCSYGNSTRFRPSKPAAATRACGSRCPQNMYQQMAVMQKPLAQRDGPTGWHSVCSRNTCSAATAHPFHSPTAAGQSCRHKRNYWERRCHDRPVATILDIIYLIKMVSVVLESTLSDPTCWPSGVGWDIRSSHPPHLTPLLLSLHAVLPSRRPGHRVMRPSGADKPRRIRRRIILQPWFSFPMRIPGASPLRAIIRNHITVSTRVHHNAITRRLTPATPPDENQMLFDNLT